MVVPCPNPTCGVRTFCRETATVGNIQYRRRICLYCREAFLTRETIYRLGPSDKNPFTIAHARRSRKEPAQ